MEDPAFIRRGAEGLGIKIGQSDLWVQARVDSLLLITSSIRFRSVRVSLFLSRYQRALQCSANRTLASPFSYQDLDRFTIQTTESITGTSIMTPTMVASPARDWKPNRLMIAWACQYW